MKDLTSMAPVQSSQFERLRCGWCRAHPSLLHIDECLECQGTDADEVLRRAAERVREFLERREQRQQEQRQKGKK